MTETDVISTDAEGSSASAPERRRRGGVSGMVLAELRELATSLGVSDTTGMRRNDLISEIKRRQSGSGDQLPLAEDAAEGSNGSSAPAQSPAESPAPADEPATEGAPTRRRGTRRRATAASGPPPADDAAATSSGDAPVVSAPAAADRPPTPPRPPP